MYVTAKSPANASMVSVVRDKNDKIKKPTAMSSIASAFTPATPIGPKGFDNKRDAWANALQSMSGVNTPDPITALAKVAGMGFAGYGQSKAVRDKEAGTAAFKKRLADMMSGTPSNADLMSAYNDPYADEGDQRMAWDMWQRNNPTEDQQLQRRRAQIELDQADDPQFDVQVGADGKAYYVPKFPGRGEVTQVPGFTPKPDPDKQARAPQRNTYKTQDAQGNVIEVTEEYDPTTQQWKQIGSAPYKPGGGVNVDMTGGTNKQVFDKMGERYDAVMPAVRGIYAMREAKKALMDGAITGQWADEKLMLAKMGAVLGITDPKVIANTEVFKSTMATQVAAMIKATVGSTQISNTDRAFAEAAAGGQIALDQNTMLRLLDIGERANMQMIDDYQDRFEKVYPASDTDPGNQRARTLFEIQDPVPEQNYISLPNDPVKAQQVYDGIPPGGVYMAPDGSVRRKGGGQN